MKIYFNKDDIIHKKHMFKNQKFQQMNINFTITLDFKRKSKKFFFVKCRILNLNIEKYTPPPPLPLPNLLEHDINDNIQPYNIRLDMNQHE